MAKTELQISMKRQICSTEDKGQINIADNNCNIHKEETIND